ARFESPRSARWASRDLFRPATPPEVFWRYSKQHSKQHSKQRSELRGAPRTRPRFPKDLPAQRDWRPDGQTVVPSAFPPRFPAIWVLLTATIVAVMWPIGNVAPE